MEVQKVLSRKLFGVAGNGFEEHRNNSYPSNVALAQPSGLALNRDAKELYLADGKMLIMAGRDRNPLVRSTYLIRFSSH